VRSPHATWRSCTGCGGRFPTRHPSGVERGGPIAQAIQRPTPRARGRESGGLSAAPAQRGPGSVLCRGGIVSPRTTGAAAVRVEPRTGGPAAGKQGFAPGRRCAERRKPLSEWPTQRRLVPCREVGYTVAPAEGRSSEELPRTTALPLNTSKCQYQHSEWIITHHRDAPRPGRPKRPRGNQRPKPDQAKLKQQAGPQARPQQQPHRQCATQRSLAALGRNQSNKGKRAAASRTKRSQRGQG